MQAPSPGRRARRPPERVVQARNSPSHPVPPGRRKSAQDIPLCALRRRLRRRNSPDRSYRVCGFRSIGEMEVSLEACALDARVSTGMTSVAVVGLPPKPHILSVSIDPES